MTEGTEMSRSRASRIFFAAFVLAIAASTAGAQVGVRNYRYKLTNRSQEQQFAAEILSTLPLKQTHYEVETDAQGRIARVAEVRGGDKLSEMRYSFEGDAKLPNGFESYEAGEKTGVVRIVRNEAGNRVREDHMLLGGTVAERVEYSYSPDHVEQDSYTVEGTKSEYSILSYSPKNTLIQSVKYYSPFDPGRRTEWDYDDATGLTKSRQQFINGKITVEISYTYNADGILVRTDAYKTNHVWFAADEFTDELRTKRIYKDERGTKEMRLTYDDEKRWLTETTLTFNGAFVCKFVYERFPNGTVKWTNALGPNDELWAEYPNYEVFDVKRNGESTETTLPGTVIHKTGNWW
jgi:hypothetical protein